MPENHNSSETMSKRSHRYWMCGGREQPQFLRNIFNRNWAFLAWERSEFVAPRINNAVLAAYVSSRRYLAYCSIPYKQKRIIIKMKNI